MNFHFINLFFAKTFIRNATGKALADSPALNAHSRAVLIPLTPTQLPHTTITVPGPGPNESHSVQSALLTTDDPDLPEAVPSKGSRPNQKDDDDDDDDDAGSDQDESSVKPNGKQDPYSNLDGAFGNYLADEPQPIAASNRAGRHGDLDDLLF